MNDNDILDMLQDAQRVDRKARIGLPGGSGHGKTMTALRFATMFEEMGSGGKIALIDTEEDTASLYAANPGETVDNEVLFRFKTVNFAAPYETTRLIKMINAIAHSGQYEVLIIDSLSHFWSDEGGVLDQSSMIEKSSRMNGFQAMAKAKKLYYHPLVAAIIAAPIHIIVTLRSKHAYDVGSGSDGKFAITRIGEKPKMEDSFLYELDLTLVATPNNIFTVDKTRFSEFADKTVSKPKRKWILPFAEWLAGGIENPYKYQDGTAAASAMEKTYFNEYKAAHNGDAPPTVETLRTWYAVEQEKEE